MRYFYISITIFVFIAVLLALCYYLNKFIKYKKEVNKEPDENDLL